MKTFMMLIRENADYGNLSDEAMQEDIQKHITWVEELVRKGQFKAGNPLSPAGSILKGNAVTDGPFIEVKECVSGYYLLLADSLEEAITIAGSCPDLQRGASLELREILETDE